MFGFLKRKKGVDRGNTVGNCHSGDAAIEAMKDEFFKHFNEGERVGAILGDAHYRKAYDIAKEWTKVENTNRSFGCLAAAAFKLGVSNMDRAKLQEAHDIYERLSKHSPDYKRQLAAVKSAMKGEDELASKIRSIMNEK